MNKMLWNGLPVIIFGSGGISKEIYSLIKYINSYNSSPIYNFIGFVGNTIDEIGKEIIDSYKIVSCDDNILDFTQSYSTIGIVIPIGNPNIKSSIFNKVNSIPNVVFPNIIHPTIKFDKDNVLIGMGNILTAGVNLTCDIEIGDFNLVNLNSTIGHDTKIGNFNVINPLVAISGNVLIGNKCLIGTGAKVLQGLNVDDNVIVGAGSVVVKDVESATTVVGVPAKPLMRK